MTGTPPEKTGSGTVRVRRRTGSGKLRVRYWTIPDGSGTHGTGARERPVTERRSRPAIVLRHTFEQAEDLSTREVKQCKQGQWQDR